MRERITTAQLSDDLGEADAGELGDVDIIRACGMVGAKNPLGLSVWRWRYGGDGREMFAVATAFIEQGYEPALVAKVMAHLADDVCRHCEGRGYEKLPGVPVLSDEICVHCQGTGRAVIHGDAERALVEEIARIEREVAGAIMKKLARQMEF